MSRKRPEYYSGVPWVHVTPAEARAHPMGRPGPLLIGIGLFFIATAAWKGWATLAAGAGVGWAVANSAWPFLTGLGLIFGVPWAVVMAGISAALTLWFLVRNLGADGGLYYLFEMIAYTGILFYLVDGERPNLVYRHRYRKYSAGEGEG